MTQHGNASKKQNHKTNLMSSSLNLKLKRLYSTDFHSHGQTKKKGFNPICKKTERHKMSTVGSKYLFLKKELMIYNNL